MGKDRICMPRKVEIIKENITLTDDVEVVYEKIVTKFGSSAKIDAQKKYIGKRAYVIILKD
jgi:putative transposon-encoded protein